MTHLSKTGQRRLSECDTDLITLFTEVDKRHNYTAICGHRGKVVQDAAFANGDSQVRWPNSKHNSKPSLAIDAAPYTVEIRGIEWDDIKAICVFAGRVLEIAEQLLEQGKMSRRVRWGGDWDMDGRTTDQMFNDLTHFELI